MSDSGDCGRVKPGLSVRGLVAGYGGTPVVKDVSLDVPRGRVTLVIGANGSGKSTLAKDADGLYHPGSFNDRLLLGLKRTMSEAELHVLRARLDGGIRNKAARGELRRGLPVGLVWGDQDGEVLLHPDEAIRGAIASISERFAEFGSVRQVWLWMRREGVQFPQQRFPHPGFINRDTFEANRERIAANTRPRAHEPGGAVREGAALLQGLAVCGRCGRKLMVHYQGRRGHQSPAYHCPSSERAVAIGACGSAGPRSIRPSPPRCWRRSRPPA
jgi:energy-coupling factor transporter ATP-binding protein EcfA2